MGAFGLRLISLLGGKTVVTDTMTLDELVERQIERSESAKEVLKRALEGSLDLVTGVLRMHLYSEQILEAQIKASLAHPDKILGPRYLTYARKLDLVEALGALHEESIGALRSLNQIRNKCAHELDYTVTLSDINSIGYHLRSQYPELRERYRDDLQVLAGRLFSLLGGLLAGQLREHLEGSRRGA